MATTLYDILELPQYASLKQVKSSFKQLAVRYHPDKNPGNKQFEERFKEISNAYQVLGNEEAKQHYDLQLSGYIHYVRKEKTEEDKQKERQRKYREAMKRKAERERAKVIREYEKLQTGVPLWIKHALNYVIILFGVRLIFSNWIHTVDTFSPTSYVFALVIILVGSIKEQNLNYTIWLYQKQVEKARFNIPFRFMRNLALSITFSILLAIGGAQMMELYHFTYYPAKMFADVKVEMVDKHRMGFTVTYVYSVDGVKYRKEVPDDMLEHILPGRKVWIQYSHRNPKYARIIPID